VAVKKLDPSTVLGTERRRAATLAVLVALIFAVLGSVRGCAPAGYLAEAPVDADLALRTLALGWFEPAGTTPVAIVAIDAATWQGWGTPAVTPRAELVQLLQVASAANPRAVVLDIDLSFGVDDAGGNPDDAILRDYLANYAGTAPVILPKRLEIADDGRLRAARSPLDAVVAANPRLAWAHAAFETADGGAVRQWSPWLGLCGDGESRWLPAVALRVAELAPPGQADAVRDAAPPAGDPCAGTSFPSRRLLVGPRLSDPARPSFTRDARSVPAALLLDPDVARDDAQLFGGRVVFIGATHASAGDAWLTVAGVYPGVELLANTVRYAPLHSATLAGASFAFRAKALLFFAMFAACVWWLRGLAVLLAAGVSALALVIVAAGAFDDLAIFDALEAGVLLLIVWVALRAIGDFVADWRTLRRSRAAGVRGWLATLKAVCVRQD
jgi:CHASE2 domain-containing sensor protein